MVYLLKMGGFSIVMLVYQRVNPTRKNPPGMG
jgi:hypothetical protein